MSKSKIKWIENRLPKTDDKWLSLMSKENVDKVREFHAGFPMYEKTPLAKLNGLAKYLGVKGVYVKDESWRFGLNAFKVLGGSYAIGSYIAERLGKEKVSYNYLISEDMRRQLGQVTFFTATDGNHGRGVAWAANKLGQRSVVFMPKGSQEIRRDNIAKEGAIVTIEEVNYDECVRIANAAANVAEKGVMVQDTAWPGYEKIPAWIMQGYGTMASECAEQIQERPTHIFVQAGVGSLAGAVQGYFANLYPGNCPTTVVVESDLADCHYLSSVEGKMCSIKGDMPTMMAGLACGEPNTISFDILANHTSFFASCPDWVSARGMRILSAPINGDLRVVSGESGAVNMGLFATIMQHIPDFKEALGLDENSVVLMFSTEGDTDPENYRRVVWEGENS